MATGALDAGTVQALGSTNDVMRTYVVSEEDVSGLVTIPSTWREKATLPRMGYQTVLEAVAEKHHATEGLIRRLNPGVSWPNPPAGTALTVPDPFPARLSSASRLTVELSRKIIQAWDADGRIIAYFPCSIGRDAAKRPVGKLRVTTCAVNPNYTYDPDIFPEEAESKLVQGKLVIAPGPNNPVGVAWIGLNLAGYGMHGTPKPEDIGKTESHGCFRLANWNAQKLTKLVTIDMPVEIEP